jgi:hypothetical protein
MVRLLIKVFLYVYFAENVTLISDEAMGSDLARLIIMF